MKKRKGPLTKAQRKERETEETASEKIREAKADAGKAGRDVREAAMKEYEIIKRKMNDTSMKVEDYIKKHPKKATLISAGVGTALGAIIALLISKKKK